MDFSADLVDVQGILNSLQREIGDFTAIRNRGGNESKIAKIIASLTSYLNAKKYLRNGKVNPKHEVNLRELHLFLLLNTELDNISMFVNHNKYTHLVNVMSRFSKCVLANVVWHLDLCRFYSEAIFSLPVEISLELLEHSNNCIKKSEPFSALEQVAMIALAIYVKMYYIRYERMENDKLQRCITKMLERFMEILQNYITPDTARMETWPQNEMYEYMGRAIINIFNLLKYCLDIFVNGKATPLLDIYQMNDDEPPYCPEKLDRSGQAMKRCNICLISVCEANLEAITVDVFCSWVEFQHKNAQMQQTIAYLAYELKEKLDDFEEVGKLPQLLEAIAIKPISSDEKIKNADIDTILQNVVVKDSNQQQWLRALIRHGVAQSEKSLEIFGQVVQLCDKNDWLALLNSNVFEERCHPALRHMILTNIINLPEGDLSDVIIEYVQQHGFNDNYEDPQFEEQVNETFNKLNEEASLSSMNQLLVFVLQNPTKLVHKLMVESVKALHHMQNILRIIQKLEPIFKLKVDNGCNILFDSLLKLVQEDAIEERSERCLIELVRLLAENELLPKYTFEKFIDIVIAKADDDITKSILMLKLSQVFPDKVYMESGENMIFKLLDTNAKIRWNFFSYSRNKVNFISESLNVLRRCKAFINKDKLRSYQCSPLDKFHLEFENVNVVSFISNIGIGFDFKAPRNEKIARLMKLLPCCVPLEWRLVVHNMCKELTDMPTLEILCDTLLMLTEISKKSCNEHQSLGYCFEQFTGAIKEHISHRNNERLFIIRILRVVKHLPMSLQYTYDMLLLRLFDLERMQNLAYDEELIPILMSISHLQMSRIISDKILRES